MKKDKTKPTHIMTDKGLEELPKRDMKKEKPNCYECKHRGEVPGSAHSSCNHPTGLKIKGNEHGIRSGWFNHPNNFDPVWLEECDGFEPIDNKKTYDQPT